VVVLTVLPDIFLVENLLFIRASIWDRR